MTLNCDLGLGHRNQNFVCDTLSYFNWPFRENLIKLASAVLSYCGYTICKVKYLWLVIVTLNLCNGNKNIVHDPPSYFGLPFFEIWLNCLTLLRYCRYMICKGYEPITYELDLSRGNLNFKLDTSSHNALPLCEIWLNSLQLLLRYCGHTICKWQTFDLGLWHWLWSWEPKFCVWHSFSFCFIFLWNLIKFL